MKDDLRKQQLIQLMRPGMEKAAQSLSNVIAREVTIDMEPLPKTVVRMTDACLQSNPKQDLLVLTTQIIGSLNGKSFLVLDAKGINEISKIIPAHQIDKLKEALLLEIDNIISAAVISVLSNQLMIEIYGDVPRLSKIKCCDLSAFIQAETKDHSLISIDSVLHLSPDAHLNARFLWSLDSKVLTLLPIQQLSS